MILYDLIMIDRKEAIRSGHIMYKSIMPESELETENYNYGINHERVHDSALN